MSFQERAANFNREAFRQVAVRAQRAYEARMTPEQYSNWKKAFNQQREVLSGQAPFDRQGYENTVREMRTNPTYLMFSNPHEFLILKQFFTEPRFMWNYEHETQHFYRAIELGFQNPMIGIFHSDDEQGNLRVQYVMHPGEIPQGMSDEQMVEALRQITAAPTSLSDGDKYVLGQE